MSNDLTPSSPGADKPPPMGSDGGGEAPARGHAGDRNGSHDEHANTGVLDRLATKLDEAIDEVAKAKKFAKSKYQTDVFQLVEALMGHADGHRVLYARAHRFDEAGVFVGGPWADPSKLQPPLVAGSLAASGVYPVVETMSELRMLAIAKGKAESDRVSSEEAEAFLDEVMALNLMFLFPGDTEQERVQSGPHRQANIALFQLLASELDLSHLRHDVVSEIEQICAQRPIMTDRVRSMIEMAARIPRHPADPDPDSEDKLTRYAMAIHGPSPLSQEHRSLTEYRRILKSCDEAQLEHEATAFGSTMSVTGLICPHHAVLLRHLSSHHSRLLTEALSLSEIGKAELDKNLEFARSLIRVAILPANAQAIYGLSKLLERGLLSRREIVAGLHRIVELDFHSDVRRALLSRRKKRDGVTANSMLLAGAIAMLGQPLGIGQGNNPTCQAARGLSLWAQHAPGYLIELLVSAARDAHIELEFGGIPIRSDALPFSGLARKLDPDLDPVSLVLVPHLDKIYDGMMRQVALRTEDGHKWVNPALYGRWVSSGFASVFLDIAQTTVANYEDFARRFFATHHPSYNDGHQMMYPNPVGLCVTNSHGDYLGPHAISLQRVSEDTSGHLRCYFFNPNNEGRQDWGHGVKPSIQGNGEREGESSLTFHQFVSRIYAFHYNPYEEGDGYAVPDAEVQEIQQMAKNSWGQAFAWQ
ncbi:MAG: hypothetical protein RIF41_40275 [Polyangiaceae bacterium]